MLGSLNMLRSRGRLSGLKKPHQDYLSESLQRFSSKNELNESDDLNSLKYEVKQLNIRERTLISDMHKIVK
jgi:prenyltransferase beta subunit